MSTAADAIKQGKPFTPAQKRRLQEECDRVAVSGAIRQTRKWQYISRLLLRSCLIDADIASLTLEANQFDRDSLPPADDFRFNRWLGKPRRRASYQRRLDALVVLANSVREDAIDYARKCHVRVDPDREAELMRLSLSSAEKFGLGKHVGGEA